MNHSAKVTLPLEQVQIHIGLVPVMLRCAPLDLNVEYEFIPGAPANDEGPADVPVFKVLAARLVRALALHDSPDTLSLIFSPNTDLLPYLGDRQVDWIEENLPVPGAPA